MTPPNDPRPRDGQAAPAARERIAGVDAARALAVFGMLTVHLGVGSLGLAGLLGQEAADTFHGLARGRSSALFAFLAGLSLALMTGRTRPLPGPDLRRPMARILVRAIVLALLGMFLDLLDAPVAVILAYYAGFFVLALPLLRLGPAALACTAAAIAVAGPQASFAIRSAMGGTGFRENSIGGITDLLLTGYYPAFTFMAFVVAGMAVGRLDLAATRVRIGMVCTGAGLALLGYGGSWLLLFPLGGVDRLASDVAASTWGTSDLDTAALEPMRDWVVEEMGNMHGQVPTDSPVWLLIASPHSGTSYEAIGAIGTSLLVLTACLFAAERARVLLYPLSAAGAMALTVYAGHIVVMAIGGMSFEDVAPFRWEAFVGTALVACTAWKLLLGRGPLERALGWLGDRGADLVPDRIGPVRQV
ncbi:heparan-alpha-glucosaminide N-acetyltransferase domain-containing protein [Nocardiopsis halophila]|uniref:heparan-alpha-glucosaminide N-acetyltransferase domain-containing protein n=1 Tax=Nocardiopsis halophila TaxID=141692 RepID=UPI000347E5B5|nr:heparan-alpha-glucosaminide N-acetyltransferase domain-containing protein [Nocardiopsis halophila]